MSHVVIVEGQTSRGFELIRIAVEMGHEATFVTSDLPIYLRGRAPERTDLRYAARVIEGASTADPEALAALLAPLAAAHPVDAILSLNDEHLWAVAVVAERLGLRHTALDTVELVRDKFRCRERLAQHGIAQPAHRLAADADAAAAAAAELGYPVVVKPVDGSASVNVGVAYDAADVRRLAAAIFAYTSYGRSASARRQALVETYLLGPLVSCETFSSGGRHVVLGVTDRVLTPLPTQVELSGCFPAPLPAAAAVVALCRSALDAIGFDTGTAHTEMILHETGPQIVEINGRLAGGVMPLVFGAALQRDVLRDVLELWLHGTLPAPGTPRRIAAIQTIVARSSGTISAIVPSPQAGDPDVIDYDVRRVVGDRVRPPTNNRDRLGSVICVAPTAEAARAKAKAVVDGTVIEIDEDAPVGAGTA